MTAAGHALTAALAADVTRLLEAEPEVRGDEPDSVHQMRVATRRLRSVLRSYRSVFRAGPAAEVTAELKWLAELLGVARDAEVRGDRFATLLVALDEVPGEVVDALVGAEHDAYAEAHTRVLAELDTGRYTALRDTLSAWRSEPPLRRGRAAAPAADAFAGILDHDRDRLRALVLAEPAAATADRVELLHDIRKAAKRLRYAADAAADVLGDDAAELGKRAKQLQTVLGDHRDAVESGAVLRARAEGAHGRAAEVYEILVDTEADAAGRALARYPAAAAFVTGP
ncbi:CHAD domain-containing protein [Nocardia thailandica]